MQAALAKAGVLFVTDQICLVSVSFSVCQSQRLAPTVNEEIQPQPKPAMSDSC